MNTQSNSINIIHNLEEIGVSDFQSFSRKIVELVLDSLDVTKKDSVLQDLNLLKKNISPQALSPDGWKIFKETVCLVEENIKWENEIDNSMNSIDSNSENPYLFETELCGVKIISSSTQFEWKRTLYCGKIWDDEFNFTISTMRVLKWVIENYPQYYKTKVNDVRPWKKLIWFSDWFEIEYIAKFGFRIVNS